MSIYNHLSDDEIRCCLTSTFLAIAETVSVKTAVKLIEEYGGCELCIPGRYSPGHKLEVLLGIEELDKLIYFFKGEEIEVPISRVLKRKARNKKIFQVWQTGRSNKEIARQFDLTTRAIRGIVKRIKDELKKEQPNSPKETT